MDKRTHDYDRDIVFGLKMFFEDYGISNHTVSSDTGITMANLRRILNGDTELSLPTLVRIASAYRKDGIIEYLFDNEIQKCLNQSVKNPDIFSGTDLTVLMILLADYFTCGNDHQAESMLNGMYYALTFECSLLNPGERNSFIERKAYDENRKSYAEIMEMKSKNPADQVLYKSFYDSAFWNYSFKFNSDTETVPAPYTFRMLLRNGETVVWQDVSQMLVTYRKESEKSAETMTNTKTVRRIERQVGYFYKNSDVMGIDDEMGMNGVFYSACYLATRNSILMKNVVEMISPENPLDFRKLEPGIGSFVSMLRFLETRKQWCEGCEEFLKGFRSEIFYSPYHWDLLQKIAADFPELLPENPLLFYKDYPLY